ncbi:MAG: hypothetical protein NLN65_07910, partial [Candidatus Poseidoniaceae archaeon]|nr:hypothetical protein [Candidatus Poseidoniaceae archaeon]
TQIRIELVVYDGADKYSEMHKMYFEVVPADFGDEIPVIDGPFLAVDQDCPQAPCRIVDGTITVIGTLLAGNEGGEGDVTVEIAFSPETLNASGPEKFKATGTNTYQKAVNLEDSDTFSLTLSLDGKYSNRSLVQTIYIKVYEGDEFNQRNAVYKQIDISLPACQGVEANLDAEAAGGEWILDEDGNCAWSGEWTFENGEWKAPQSTTGEDSAESAIDGLLVPALIGIILIVVVLFTLLFIRKGSEDDTKDFSVDASGFGGVMDQTEQYVQQLIAQGYPEETARSYAQQYASQAAAAAPAAAAPVAAAPAMDDAVYQQYYQQFTSQGYDPQTAATYAQQYALQYAQSQQ